MTGVGKPWTGVGKPWTRRWFQLALLVAATIPAAQAQFQLFVLEGNSETALPTRYALPGARAGDLVETRFRLRNIASAPAPLSFLEVRGAGFQMALGPSLPVTVGAKEAVDFTVAVRASEGGLYSAALVSQGVSVLLTIAVEAALPLPAPRIAINLARAQSGQQGSVSVQFAAPAERGGSGTATLDFKPNSPGAADATIAFATGGRTALFTFAAGDRQGSFGNQSSALFQTGTTAGDLAIQAQIGSLSDSQTVSIAPAAPTLTLATGTRTGDTIELRLTGFDNTRTAGPLTFTFSDAAGNPIQPGTIRADATAAFTEFFRTSDTAGAFLLRAVFPLTGDGTHIASFEAQISNSTGAATTGRKLF